MWLYSISRLLAIISHRLCAIVLCSIVNQESSKLNLNPFNAETAFLTEQLNVQSTNNWSADSRRRPITDDQLGSVGNNNRFEPVASAPDYFGAISQIQNDQWASSLKCDQSKNGCYNGGKCLNGTCLCEPGWSGQFCESCAGRTVKIGPSGFISTGALNYSRNTKCTWLLKNVDDDANSTADSALIFSLEFNHFCTECGWDGLHFFDGDTIYSSKMAVFSGCLPSGTVKYYKLSSDSVVAFFSSDSAYNMSGFNISYSFSSCATLCQNACQPTTQLCNCASFNSSDIRLNCLRTYCLKNCQNGRCVNETCQCQAGFKGRYCNISSSDPAWLLVQPVYEPDFVGPEPLTSSAMLAVDKSLWWFGGYNFDTPKNLTLSRYDIALNVYQKITVSNHLDGVPQNRYDHTVVFHNEQFYVFGGVLEPFNITNELWTLNASKMRWKKLGAHKLGYSSATSAPFHVHGHTSHVIDNSMLVFFGYNPYRGYINIVQEYNIVNNSWFRLETFGARPPGLFGHSSALDPRTKTVYVFGGYGAISAYSGKLYDHLYAFHVPSRHWIALPSVEFPLFLHSVTFLNNLLIVIGGNGHNESSDLKTKCFSDALLVYDIDCYAWKTIDPTADLPTADLSFYGHSAAAYKNDIFVFGGFNGQFLDKLLRFSPGDCSDNRDKDACLYDGWAKGAKCAWSKNRCSPTYDRDAQSLVKQMSGAVATRASPPQSIDQRRLPSASSSDESPLSRASAKSDASSCRASLSKFDCQRLYDCQSCASAASQSCNWCASGRKCATECNDGAPAISSWQSCPPQPFNCSQFYSCNSCKYSEKCIWDRRNKLQSFSCLEPSLPERVLEGSTVAAVTTRDQTSSSLCYKPCVFITNCESCSKQGCIWCPNSKRCVDTNGYLTAFPYGQCLQYSNFIPECAATVECPMHLTCPKCQAAGPGCGWCDDGSQTGSGRCVDGGLGGPRDDATADRVGETIFCSYNRWFFIDCPACQCNGHAKCTPFAPAASASLPSPLSAPYRRANESLWWLTSLDASSRVTQRLSASEDGAVARFSNNAVSVGFKSMTPSPMQCLPCSGKTAGEQCETCIDGYYGNALNGGNCSVCQCNGHATSCNPYTGKCYCSTKGILGHHCDRCENKYVGNAINGTCYYDLLPDYIYTFNLNAEEDYYVTRINFICRPTKPDIDVSFKLSCSSPSGEAGKIDLNITNDFDAVRGLSSRRILKGYPCHEVQRTFSTEEFQFGTDINTTFYIVLHSFKNPAISISFAQSQNIDWMRFFITFALCFFVLLVLAFILWKVKQKLDVYRRRQRLFLEMAQMANRPFGTMHLDWSKKSGSIKKQCPGVIALEPCADYRAAVVTVALRLPTGSPGGGGSAAGGKFAPHGQSALAFGSTLCYLPSQYVAQLQTAPTPPPTAGEEKVKRWRRPACIS